MADSAATTNHALPSQRRRTAGRLSRLLVVATAGAALLASAPAFADVAETGPSYQLGYTKAVQDGGFTVGRMRAMGFPDDAIVISSQVHKVCARELASVQAVAGVNDADFLRGCASGVQSLVDAGMAS
ncbi:hypothetical protein PJK45_18540 [Mycobacterium kansasii]|uniref:DUF732 domain-containing protein n=3 Tax=Mycobacterium kansasii TaxID=1768 RepID=A0A1V3X6J8_MYCKA|nr:hypothetical protein [Mycobacterium kansasii]ETZ97889.1 hypothetical protein I547_6861 [Mycobacterium kansasii 824]AGZ50811.1 hypothetical protein MKAN_11500 [Mycobacterium kansasii ATCC 12478]ARG57396.1 hypothetical protein B1T43_17675 [Mycobacterium kansasii]ARG62899.1 hypothetical protein B1T45_18060 [Mycobacterium kansasii]ARG70519.1 hypothetical protein B1T47_17300 [Mycobacterium kansasii]